ncbi:MAG: class I SAM-dependent methyltransferase [Anaerolineae bacterium]|nr:class I SAM-dependent methyltransferase [Anaerolineae bacterium]
MTEYDAFAESYDLEYGQYRGDLEFYTALASQAALPVLELACGTGRVTIPIARAGVPITGVDSSVGMLVRAREKADAIGGLPVTWVEGDMRTFALEQRFGLAIIPARSFLHLLTPDDQKAALRNIHTHLIAGGRLAINFFVPNLQRIAEISASALRGALQLDDEYVDPLSGQRVIVWHSQSYDTYRQRIHVRFVYERVDDAGAVIARQHKSYTLCYIHRNEMQHLLELCGYAVDALYGDFAGSPFGPDSKEMVWVARKR